MIDVNIKNVKRITEDYTKIIGKLKVVNNQIKDIHAEMYTYTYSNVRKALVNIAENNEEQVDNIKNLEDILLQIVQQYEKTEKEILGITEEKDRSRFAKFVGNDIKINRSVISKEKSDEGKLWGINTAGTVGGKLFTGEAGVKTNASWKFKDNNGNWDFKTFGLTTTAYASGAVAKGTAEGNIGYLYGKTSAQAITGTVKGEARMNLWNDGKWNPSMYLAAGATASVLQGAAEVGVGNKQYGIYAKADGDVLHAEAEAKAGVGYLGKDADGNARYGAEAKASAMASIAQGKVKGGITIAGIDLDVGVKGYAGAVGVEAGASVTTDGATATVSGALALGGGLDISVDWSDAEWIADGIDWIGDRVEDVGDLVGEVFE